MGNERSDNIAILTCTASNVKHQYSAPIVSRRGIFCPFMTLILASTSPRRAALLRDAGIAFTQRDPAWSDPAQPPPGDAEQVAIATARRKALSVEVAPDDVVLASDTLIVYPDGVTLAGTPTTRDEARTMIKSFLNADHDVVTAVGLRQGERIECFADRATVSVGHVDDGVLEAYLQTGAWRDKAGGYNLFDRRDAGWPITVHGDETTVVGLPMRRLAAMLRKFHHGDAQTRRK